MSGISKLAAADADAVADPAGALVAGAALDDAPLVAVDVGLTGPVGVLPPEQAVRISAAVTAAVKTDSKRSLGITR